MMTAFFLALPSLGVFAAPARPTGFGIGQKPQPKITYMMGQYTACIVAKSTAAAILANANPYILLTTEDPPYPPDVSSMCPPAGSPPNAVIASWNPIYVIRFSAYDRHATPPSGLHPAVVNGNIPTYVSWIMYDNELETSQNTPVNETNNPPSFYPLAAADVHSIGKKFFATGGQHLTPPCQTGYSYPCPSNETPGWVVYPCVAPNTYPCPAQELNDLYSTATVWDGFNIQSQTALPDISSFTAVIRSQEQRVNQALAAAGATDAILFTAGTGTIGRCDTCQPGQLGLLTQSEMDLGAMNIAAGTPVWWNVGPHQGPSCNGPGCNCTTDPFTGKTACTGIPDETQMGVQELINLQSFVPPAAQP